MQPAAERRTRILRYVFFALVLWAIFTWLGTYVAAHGEPPAFWRFAKNVRGGAVELAWLFTNCGWGQVLAPLYALALAAGLRWRQWRSRVFALVGGALVAWGAADLFQRLYDRPRRSDWLIRHEHAFSYPSSHATISTAFYLGAAILLLRSELPPAIRYGGFAAATAMWLGILWSRLSLAAHYPTDVAGGVCLGGGILLCALAAARPAGIVRNGA